MQGRVIKEIYAQTFNGNWLYLLLVCSGDRPVFRRLVRLGKSGGSRVIYFLATAEVIYQVLAYPNSVKDSLTAADKGELRQLVQQLKSEV